MKLITAIVEEGNLEALEASLASREGATKELDEALFVAARLGRVQAMRMLVEAGASVEALGDRTGWRPLHVAVENGQLGAISEVVALGASVDAKAAEGMTALHLAVDVATDFAEQEGGSVDSSVIRLLLSLGADPGVEDDAGSTARDWAGEAGADVLLTLLS